MSSDAPPSWGGATTMNAFETVMWRIEADPALRTSALTCLQLEAAPPWDRLVETHDRAVRLVPRLRQRVVEPPLALGVPRWTTDDQFDLRFHLHRRRLPVDGGWAELMSDVSQFYMAPLDRARAPWEAVLIDGLPDGRALYALKMHHSVTDGLGVMQLLGMLFADHPEEDEPAPPTEAAMEDPVTPWEVLREQLGRDVRAGLDAVRWAGRTGARALADPVGTAGEVGRFAASLRRVLSPPAADNSALLARRSLTLRLAAVDVPFRPLKAAAQEAGGSVNDAFLAALLGGYRHFHQRMGAPAPPSVPTAMPISLRRPDDPHGGNRIASARFAGPLVEPDPAARIAQIRQIVREVREEPAVDVIGLLSPLLARLPGDLVAVLAGPMTKANDLHASNVPGLRTDHFLAGSKIERFYGYGPLGGGASLITLVTHGDTACIGVGVDTASFTEHTLFLECLAAGFDEVLALAPDGGKAEIRG
jgi:diacylglycerol O-acyltransferase / wax synthase